MEFRKSSFSDGEIECVEVADLDGGARAVRHSKNPGGGLLVFTAGEWAAFLAGVMNGEFS